MKLHSLTIMVGTAVCLLAACSREQLAPEPQGRYTITAIRESGGTKTSVDEDYSLNWNAEDVIGVFNGADHHGLALTAGDGTPTATFELLEGTLEEGDVFAYYPYDEGLRVVDDIPFAVATNQNAPVEGRGMDGYEASDFLWADSPGVEASNEPVVLSFRHRMSRLVVRLIPGEDYEGDIPEDARVYVHNTVPEATIDLSVGLATKDAYASAQTIEAKKEGTGEYAAIVVPQRLDNQVPLIEIVVEGVSYMVERKFVFKQGIQHTVSVTLAKNPDQVKIEIGGEIEEWDK